NPPATDEEIANWEKANRITLPEDYKEWLRFSNGSQFIFDMTRLFGLDEILVSPTFFPESLIIFGSFLGFGEALCFTKNPSNEVIGYDFSETRRYENFKCFLNYGPVELLKTK
ncbi:MAG: SMI1/KNR4 family protein, partial [Ruminococcus sp.]|nr:SMI1/KNR4 family protein [Ruminococcus sp.]